MTSHHFLPLLAANAPRTQARTAQATLMGARHSRYGGMKILVRRTALAIPAFVDLFTPPSLASWSDHSIEAAVFGTLLTTKQFDAGGPEKILGSCYLRRDFAFAVAMTANGEATVMKMRVKTITNPNIEFLAFSLDSAWNRSSMALCKARGHNTLVVGNNRKVANAS